MATYELGFEIGASAAAGAPLFALRATTRRLRLKEVRILSADATQMKVGLAVPPGNQSPAAVATTSLTPNAVRPDIDPAATARIDTAWSTPPAVPSGSPTPWNRIEQLAGVIGQGVAWVEPDFLDEIAPPATSVNAGQIVVYNAGGGTSGALTVYVRFED